MPATGHCVAELTFILLAGPALVQDANTDTDAHRLLRELLENEDEGPVAMEHLKVLPMVGDVNLFLKGVPGEDDFEAEVEIMIAGVLHPTCVPACPLA